MFYCLHIFRHNFFAIHTNIYLGIDKLNVIFLQSKVILIKILKLKYIHIIYRSFNCHIILFILIVLIVNLTITGFEYCLPYIYMYYIDYKYIISIIYIYIYICKIKITLFKRL